MKKLIALTSGAVGATAVSMAVFGSGVAAADDYAGQTYADASSALSDAGLKGVIATRVGDALPDELSHARRQLELRCPTTSAW